jgi:hypothetical protein
MFLKFVSLYHIKLFWLKFLEMEVQSSRRRQNNSNVLRYFEKREFEYAGQFQKNDSIKVSILISWLKLKTNTFPSIRPKSMSLICKELPIAQ